MTRLGAFDSGYLGSFLESPLGARGGKVAAYVMCGRNIGILGTTFNEEYWPPAWRTRQDVPGSDRTEASACSACENRESLGYLSMGFRWGFGYFRSMQSFNPSEDAWTTRHSLPAGYDPRADHGSGVIRDKVYMFMGTSPGGVRYATLVFDPQEPDPIAAWATLESGGDEPVAVCFFQGVVIDECFFLAGGHTGSSTKLCLTQRCCPFDGIKWSIRQDMILQRERSEHGAAEYGGAMYVFGGRSNIETLDSCERYEPQSDSWSGCQSMNYPRYWTVASRIENRLYVFGGYCGGTPLTAVERYSPLADSWQTSEEFFMHVGFASACSMEG